jgi:hypothetical protein
LYLSTIAESHHWNLSPRPPENNDDKHECDAVYVHFELNQACNIHTCIRMLVKIFLEFAVIHTFSNYLVLKVFEICPFQCTA